MMTSNKKYQLHMVILKILAYITSILLVLYGLFGKVLRYEEFIPYTSEKLRKVLYAILVVFWRISFTASGIALFIIVKKFSDLSQVQFEILVAIVFNPLLILIAIGVGFVIVGGLYFLLMLLGGCLGLFFFEVLSPYIFEPLFEKLGRLSDKIGLTPKLDKLSKRIDESLTKWGNKILERRYQKKQKKVNHQNE